MLPPDWKGEAVTPSVIKTLPKLMEANVSDGSWCNTYFYETNNRSLRFLSVRYLAKCLQRLITYRMLEASVE